MHSRLPLSFGFNILRAFLRLTKRRLLPKRFSRTVLMPSTLSMVGIEPEELRWIRMLVALLRHPDPSMPELARQALIYLTESATRRSSTDSEGLDQTG
jgi:hypothetical protein